jgi:DNA-binding transcriptional ArsR family regulator
MSGDESSRPIDAAGVARASQSLIDDGAAGSLGSLLTLLADPVRLRMLFALVAVDEMCVGDLALALDVSMDQSSYALKQLRIEGLVETRRAGRMVFYRLADGFPHPLLEHCLRELLTITDRKARP